MVLPNPNIALNISKLKFITLLITSQFYVDVLYFDPSSDLTSLPVLYVFIKWVLRNILLIPWNGFAVIYSKDDFPSRINGILFSPFA